MGETEQKVSTESKDAVKPGPRALTMTAKQADVLNQMTKDGQVLARRCLRGLSQMAKGSVLLSWEIGSMVEAGGSDTDKYGTDWVTKMTELASLGKSQTSIDNMSRLAKAFDKPYLERWVDRPMANGRYLDVSHFTHVATVPDPAKREELLEAILANSYSARAVDDLIKLGPREGRTIRPGSGRSPKPPATPLIGVKKANKLMNSAVTYLDDIVPEHVLTPLEESPQGKACEVLSDLVESILAMKSTIASIESRCKKLVKLCQKAAEDEGNDG